MRLFAGPRLLTISLTINVATADSPVDPPRFVRWLIDPWGMLTGGLESLGARLGPAGRWLVLALGTVPLLALATRAALRRWRAARLTRDARYMEVLPPPQPGLDGAEALWRHLAGLLRPHRWRTGRPHLAFEYRWSADRLRVGLWLPGTLAPRLVERAVEAAWPGARTRTSSPPPDPIPPGRRVTGGRLRLARPEWYGLRTEFDADPLRPLLGAAGEVGGGEHAAVQFLARPARGRRVARCRRAARALRHTPPDRGGLAGLLWPSPGSRSGRGGSGATDPARAAEIRAILTRATEPCWEVAIHYAVATTTSQHWRGRVRSLAHALAAAFEPFTDRNWLKRARLHRPTRALAQRRLDRGDLLSVSELAALAHLPTDPSVPGLARAGARAVAPSPAVPTVGKVLGDADAGPARPVALGVADARQHLHVMGATGSGKSTLLAQLVLQDAAAGRGAVVIDPRGDLVRDLLDRLPASVAGRLVLLDPDDRDAPPALNMLEGDPDLATDHLLSIFRRVFAAAWGPRTDDILRAACLSLLGCGPASLRDVPRLLTEPGFRHRRLAKLTGQAELRAFWSWYDQLTPAAQATLIGPALSRLRAFLLRGFASRVIDTSASSFDLGEVLDGGLLLARLPKGTLGDDASRLLGSMVVAKVWLAAAERARADERTRADASLYVDEAHNYLHLPFGYDELLAEARGYRLGLVLAHHNLAQLPKELREALATNARSKLWFAASPEDAHHLARHTAPELIEHDLAHLGAYQAAARLVADGVELPACTLITRPLPRPVAGRAERLRAAARRRYGRTETQRRQHALRRELAHDDAVRRNPSRHHSRHGPQDKC